MLFSSDNDADEEMIMKNRIGQSVLLISVVLSIGACTATQHRAKARAPEAVTCRHALR